MSDLRFNCAGLPRRDFLQLGLGAVMGMGFGDLLRVRASAAEAAGQVSPNPVNCILIWMDGGPTHYETFDPKPEAPSEIRGDFKPIRTKVPGTYFAEVVPNHAGRKPARPISKIARPATRMMPLSEAISPNPPMLMSKCHSG